MCSSDLNSIASLNFHNLSSIVLLLSDLCALFPRPLAFRRDLLELWVQLSQVYIKFIIELLFLFSSIPRSWAVKELAAERRNKIVLSISSFWSPNKQRDRSLASVTFGAVVDHL